MAHLMEGSSQATDQLRCYPERDRRPAKVPSACPLHYASGDNTKDEGEAQQDQPNVLHFSLPKPVPSLSHPELGDRPDILAKPQADLA